MLAPTSSLRTAARRAPRPALRPSGSRRLTTTRPARASGTPPSTPSPPPRSSYQAAREINEAELRALKVPSVGQRLRPLLPFFIWWSIITSLTVHLLQIKKRSEAELARAHAQESVLRGLAARFEGGELVPDVEIRRELEMVGLRERTSVTAHLGAELGELRDVGWWEVILGRKRGKQIEESKEDGADKSEQEIVKEWTHIVNEATTPTSAPETPDPLPAQRSGVAKRAQSSTVYM